MLLFRSEEHLRRWHASGDHPHGDTMTLAQQWELAQRWFADRHRAEWRKRSPSEAEEVFRSVGLAGDFWKL